MKKYLKKTENLQTGVTQEQIESNNPNNYDFHKKQKYPSHGGMRERIIYKKKGTKEFNFPSGFGFNVSVVAMNETEARAESKKRIASI